MKNRSVLLNSKTISNSGKLSSLNLRRAEKRDAKEYFHLVNDLLVRRNSFNDENIGWENHCKWFTHKLDSYSSVMLVAEQSNVFVGQVRFDLNPEDRNWMIDFSIVRDYRGKGYSKMMLSQAIHYIVQEAQEGIVLQAHVKTENLPSRRVFESLGFKILFEDSGIAKYIKHFD